MKEITAVADNGVVLRGKSFKDIRKQMCGMLSIENQQSVTAVTDCGVEIHVSLVDGADYIRTIK